MSTRIKKSDLARDALYEKVNTIADELDSNKVSKSGDTMTGQLAIKDANLILSSTKDVVTAIIKTDEDDTQTLTKNHIDGFRVLDKNNKIMSDFRSQRKSASNLTQMIARKNNADGTIKQADITCSVDSNGNTTSTLNQTTYVNGTVVSNLDNVNFIARSKSIVKGTTPTDRDKYVGYDWQDKNGQRLAYLGVSYSMSGAKNLQLQRLDNNLTNFTINYDTYVQKLYTLSGGNSINISREDNNYTEVQTHKKDGTRTGGFRNITDSAKQKNECTMYVATDDGIDIASDIAIGKIIGGDVYTRCPKPADNSNTNAIATTNWAGGLKRENTWLASNTFKGTAYFEKNPRVVIGKDSRLISKSTNLIKGTAPTVVQYGGVSFRDKNDVEMATVASSVNKDNTVSSSLRVGQPTVSGNGFATISVNCDKDGKFFTYAPQSSRNNSIDTIVEHGQFYIKYGSGILINWGVVRNLGTHSRTITLEVPFSNVWYYANIITSYGAATVNDPPRLVDTRFNIYDKQKTYFKVQGNNTNVDVDWFAIGYWKEWVQ